LGLLWFSEVTNEESGGSAVPTTAGMASSDTPRTSKRQRLEEALTEALEEAKADAEKELEKAKELAKQEMLTAVESTMHHLPHYSRYCQTSSVAVDASSALYKFLSMSFTRSAVSHRGPGSNNGRCRAPEYDITRIERLYAPRLQEKYLAELQDIAGLCNRKTTALQLDATGVQTFPGLKLNELLLYHGAPSSLVDRLKMQGFDPRYAGGHFGKMFGLGVYLAVNSSKSDIYTEPNEGGERCVFVVRACLGESHLAKQASPKMVKPPERNDGRGPLNSVVGLTHEQGGVLDHPEMIVYRESQALPEYMIWYRHQPTCLCTHCVSKMRQAVQDVDSTDKNTDELWHFIDSKWLQQFRASVFHRTSDEFPGPISNNNLLEQEVPKSGLKASIDYRGVIPPVWDIMVRKFGGGPNITCATKKLDIYKAEVSATA
jgi:hypothetical protein